MHRVFSVAMLLLAFVTAGCATATRGTTEQVVFLSDPSGAEMTTTNGLKCVTPCTLEIERSETFTATFELAGEKKSVFVDTEVPDEIAATTVANVLATPIILIPVAVAVDAASGANLDHTPNPVQVQFSVAARPPEEENAEPSTEPDAPEAEQTFKWAENEGAEKPVPGKNVPEKPVAEKRVAEAAPTRKAAAPVSASGEVEENTWKPFIGGY